MPGELRLNLSFVFQDEVHDCMNQIEVSINLSMSGMSFQSSSNNNVIINNNASSVPKIIKHQSVQQQQQKQDCSYPPVSTTPTDVKDVSKHHLQLCIILYLCPFHRLFLISTYFPSKEHPAECINVLVLQRILFLVTTPCFN